ncbi:hypothetical protein GO730_17585 [Spirosoma sp. HMF3257]|uniref:Uncharacterized protein n=1 Tax=Spirosoma telluris TaxID=2183553 RepID=A0A327NL70_9BACT|nr:hypothetical protein [Spirosoma telluris]RAI75513.1 hypothetical protein HMF3257_17510 [Spirosoma telluris]
MAANTLIIITGYGSVTPKPWRKAYLNSSEESANQRFLKEHPGARDTSSITISFDDEFSINSRGEVSNN